MATAKKTTKKAPVAKATVKAKAPVKMTTVKKSAPRAKAAPKKEAGLKSFKVSVNQPSFSTFKITRQTVYWIILVAFIVFAQLWILKLQVEVASLLDAQQALIENI